MKVCFVGGAGEFGFPLAARAAQMGFDTTIADSDEHAIETISTRTHPLTAQVAEEAWSALNLTTSTANASSAAEIIFVCVPTPLKPDGRLSLKHVLSACRDIGEGLVTNPNPYPVVAILSTLNPGDHDKIMRMLERSSSSFCGKGFGLAYPCKGLNLAGVSDPATKDVLDRYYLQLYNHTAFYNYVSLVSAEIAVLAKRLLSAAEECVASQIAWLCHLTPGADCGSISVLWPQPYYTSIPGPSYKDEIAALNTAFLAKNIVPVMSSSVNYEWQWEVSAIAQLVGSVMELNKCKKICILGGRWEISKQLLDALGAVALPGLVSAYGYDPDDSMFELKDAVSGADLLVITDRHTSFFELPKLDLSGVIVLDLWSMFQDDELNCKKYVRFGKGEQEEE